MFNHAEKREEEKVPLMVAVESFHADISVPFLQKLEAELVANGLTTKIILLPETESLSEIKSLLSEKVLLRSAKSAAILSVMERVLTMRRHSRSTLGERGVILLNNSNLASLGWFGTLLPDRTSRVKFYKWLDEFEFNDIGLKRPDLTVFVDVLPHHLVTQDEPPKPAGWAIKNLPDPAELRQVFLEAAGLLPNTKVVTSYQNDLLLPDQNIYNKIWNLVRRVVLPKVM